MIGASFLSFWTLAQLLFLRRDGATDKSVIFKVVMHMHYCGQHLHLTKNCLISGVTAPLE